jgi:hypothetical protein
MAAALQEVARTSLASYEAHQHLVGDAAVVASLVRALSAAHEGVAEAALHATNSVCVTAGGRAALIQAGAVAAACSLLAGALAGVASPRLAPAKRQKLDEQGEPR